MNPNTLALKLVVAGPFGAGKTTFISSISEIPVVGTESDTVEGADEKPNTTVALDFGRITFPDPDSPIEMYLFGTPGQSRFSFMWKVLGEGMLGFVVVVDGTSKERWDEARDIYDYFRELSEVPAVVAVNRRSAHDPVLGEIRSHLGLDEQTAVMAVNAFDRNSVRDVLVTLLLEVLYEVESSETQEASS